ncbi:HK97 family phage prohead protease [Bacillus subtilis]|nr:HK97 family phage prohead protease [Bacillus subtilis]MDI6547295.1 HK97 family phage prohead protease [Bacillus subtilis]
MMDKEQRTFHISGLEIRSLDEQEETPQITGYGAVFNSPANIGGMFTEVIAPGAFSRALANQSDVRALFNHNWDYVLGRTRSGTLTLEEDDKGLKFTVTPPATSWASDLRSSMERGDINQCSFGFNVMKDEWNYETEPVTRTIQEVELFEISVVAFPAYEETEAVLRSGDIYKRAKKEHELRMKKQQIINKIQEATKK